LLGLASADPHDLVAAHEDLERPAAGLRLHLRDDVVEDRPDLFCSAGLDRAVEEPGVHRNAPPRGPSAFESVTHRRAAFGRAGPAGRSVLISDRPQPGADLGQGGVPVDRLVVRPEARLTAASGAGGGADSLTGPW